MYEKYAMVICGYELVVWVDEEMQVHGELCADLPADELFELRDKIAKICKIDPQSIEVKEKP